MKPFCFLLVLFTAFVATAWGDVRVLLFQTQPLQSLSITSNTDFDVMDIKTRAVLLKCRAQETLFISGTGSALHLKSPCLLNLAGPIRLQSHAQDSNFMLATPVTPPRPYPGLLEIEIQQQNLQVINQVTDTAYLLSVIANEISADWPAESLKCQAILARTYMAYHRGRHRAANADFCDLTHCQVYKGTAADPRILAALQATQGLILTRQGHVIDAVFHSVCGGKTAAAQDIWPNQTRLPYLLCVSDASPQGDYCCGKN